MKIAFGIIVCNGDDFLEQCIRQVYDFADQIVIAEGATDSWRKAMGWGDDPKSRDGTLHIIEKLMKEDQDNKISLINGIPWVNKTHQSNGYMQLIKDDTDYVWQLDSDEFYMKSDLYRVRELLTTNPSFTFLTVHLHHFWKNFKTVAVGQEGGWGWETPAPRIQKFYKGSKYIDHRPPVIIDPITGNTNDKICPANLTDLTGIRCYHYSFVTDKQVLEKMAYYSAEFPESSRLRTWVKDVWKSWDHDRHLVESKFGTHPSSWRGSYTRDFNGRHPEEIEKMRRRN